MSGPTHNPPKPFYFTATDHSPQPRIDFSYYEISRPDICSLICFFFIMLCIIRTRIQDQETRMAFKNTIKRNIAFLVPEFHWQCFLEKSWICAIIILRGRNSWILTLSIKVLVIIKSTQYKKLCIAVQILQFEIQILLANHMK